MMVSIKPLEPERLHQRTDPALFGFQTTAELGELNQVIGQPRAVAAVQLATGIEHDGFNVFALGPSGTGKRSLVMKYFQEKALSEPAPDDWCYVHNFEQDYKPKALRLPAGKGIEFQRDMAQFVDELMTALPTAFESDEYRARRRVIEEEIQEEHDKEFQNLQQKAEQNGVALLRTPAGLVFAPVKDGEVMPPDEYKKLPPEVRDGLEKRVAELQEELQNLLLRIPVWQREMRTRVRELNREVTALAVEGLLTELHTKYQKYPQVLAHLEALKKDIIENAGRFLEGEAAGGEAGEKAMAFPMPSKAEIYPLRRYQVNLLVDHSTTQGAPVIYEDNPTVQNLLGRTEHMALMGALVTDFTLIKPGALHLANGGYLILDARKVLLQPYAWEALKRALESHQVRIESLSQMLGLLSTTSLEPEPIELDVKVALLGDRLLYYLLAELDPEFKELFKVQADFTDLLPRNAENLELYARLLATLAKREKLRPLRADAVARVIEHSARIAGDAEKLSIQVNTLVDILREADYWAGSRGGEIIQAEDIQQAIEARTFRADQIRERYQENILRDMIMISTSGEQIGQINGLSVVQLSDFSFGFPSRITARVRLGKGEVINIEREVELSGPIHSKGVLILSGFLGARYAARQPLSLSASLVFEQSYSGVEGDSASSAELYALLSAIAEIPIKQSLAVTGSVNQLGQVQAIGGVNEKIEGFFDICKARGLSGEQGVIIPEANVRNLMLRRDVVEAAAAGKFHIYPVRTIDEGIELLTGIPAGEPDEQGNYPPNTVNGRVKARLDELAEIARQTEAGKEEET